MWMKNGKLETPIWLVMANVEREFWEGRWEYMGSLMLLTVSRQRDAIQKVTGTLKIRVGMR